MLKMVFKFTAGPSAQSPSLPDTVRIRELPGEVAAATDLHHQATKRRLEQNAALAAPGSGTL
jgi:hypothetical protein